MHGQPEKPDRGISPPASIQCFVHTRACVDHFSCRNDFIAGCSRKNKYTLRVLTRQESTPISTSCIFFSQLRRLLYAIPRLSRTTYFLPSILLVATSLHNGFLRCALSDVPRNRYIYTSICIPAERREQALESRT